MIRPGPKFQPPAPAFGIGRGHLPPLPKPPLLPGIGRGRGRQVNT